jgi:hypothetical protein
MTVAKKETGKNISREGGGAGVSVSMGFPLIFRLAAFAPTPILITILNISYNCTNVIAQ